MPNEKPPAEFEDVVKDKAEKYKLQEGKLREEIDKELYAGVAREIVERMIAGEVSPPKKTKRRATWGNKEGKS